MNTIISCTRAIALTQFFYKAIKASTILLLAFVFSPGSSSASACSVTVGAPACAAQTDPGSTSAAFLPSPHVANPVDVVTGNKYQHSDDYLGFGSRLQFSRHYNSADAQERTVLGPGWRHSYDVTLKRASPSRLLLKQSDGRILEFLSDEQSDTTYRARHIADGYIEVAELNRWNLSDGRILSFKGSYLVEVAYPDKRKLKLKYKNNRLESVTDHFKRSIKLEYYAGKQTLGSYEETLDGISPGDLRSLQLPDGSHIRYQYDNLQNLTAVSYPEGTQSLYEYKDPDFTHHLTGANEALESTRKYWKYDQFGRAIQHTNEAAEFVVDIEFAPTSDTQTEQRTRVKTSDGWKADYGWQHSSDINLPIVTDYQEQACPTCKPTQKRITEKSVVDWQPVSQEPKPAMQNKSAQKSSKPPQAQEPIKFVAKKGALGGTVTMRSAAGGGADQVRNAETYEVTVDRIGKVRDVSDGLDSLSEIKHEFIPRSLLNPSSLQNPANLCGGQSCENKANKLLKVAKSANQTLSIPTINSPTNQAVNNRFCAADTFRNCDQLKHDYKMAQLSNCVYADNPCGNGYVEVDVETLGFVQDDFEFDGFKAELYKTMNPEKFVLTFKGTESWEDWKNNFSQGLGKQSAYYERAKALGRKLRRKLGDFHITGHSLGGGLATAASFESGQKATIFNASSLHPNSVSNYAAQIGNADKMIVSYTVEDDILSKLQDVRLSGDENGATPAGVAVEVGKGIADGITWPLDMWKKKPSAGVARTTFAAPGQRIVLDNPSEQWINENSPKHKVNYWVMFKKRTKEVKEPKDIVMHYMSTVLESLKNKVLAQCQTLN